MAENSSKQRNGRSAEKSNDPETNGISPQTSPNSTSSSTANEDQPLRVFTSIQNGLSSRFPWVVKNWTWSKIKPVIRCAIVGWVSVVLFAIPKAEIAIGNASFLLLIAAFLSPPSDPFLSVLEREFLILLFVCVAWAWSCLAIFLADLARKVHVPGVTLPEVVSGKYIETAPTVIIAVFIFFGSAFFLYIKARQGPGPYLSASIFACLCIDICLTSAVFFPFPFYKVGQTIAVPIACHSALSLIGSLTIFPSTISAQFTTRLQDVLSPLADALSHHRSLLTKSITGETFSRDAAVIRAFVKRSEANLIPLAASARLLKSDFIYCRFAPDDFRPFQQLCRRLAGRANGLETYFILVDLTKDHFPATPSPSVPPTPGHVTPVIRSRPHSTERKADDSVENTDPATDIVPPVSLSSRSELSHSPLAPSKNRHSHRLRTSPHPHKPHHHTLHHSLASVAKSRRRTREEAVGTFESQRYLNLEATQFHDPNAEEYIEQEAELLQKCCDPPLEACHRGLTAVSGWLGSLRSGRTNWWKSRAEQKKAIQDKVEKIEALKEDISSVLEEFRNTTRHVVLEPYLPAFDDSNDDASHYRMPPHRYLFHCYVYQYHLIQIASIVLEMLDEIIKLERQRSRVTFWTPAERIFRWNSSLVAEGIEGGNDDDPNVIQGLRHESVVDLGLPRRRDPDALPAQNWLEWIMLLLYSFAASLGGGNILFALKAGTLTVALCMPFFFKSSAKFAYENRFIWAIFMGQLTIARFRGDTAFGLCARIISTFFGGITGMVMWYISTGSGRGNAFGLAAVCGVCFFFFFFARLYLPLHPMTNMIFFLTTVLVLGYSYQDQHIDVPGSPGFGVSVAWRRFVLVVGGVVAAFIMSFLPPSSTIRRYHRDLVATTSCELGAIYCSILSFANTKDKSEIQDIITSLIAIRSKLNRSVALKSNVGYEFSLRGRWPAQRYQNIVDLQVAIAFSLSHLMSVVEHLEPNWTRAFLRRTRFMDPDFQGDILAVISMITSSLRTGGPLPQITPCPLLDRFMLKYHGLDVIHKDAEEDYGLPRSLNLETLKNEQYLIFCVGIATAFGIINRLDRLMLATKEIVGEQYHIHGVGFSSSKGGGVPLGPRLNSVHFEPPREV